MDEIQKLNQPLDFKREDFEIMIDEMMKREEFACTGNVCTGNAVAI